LTQAARALGCSASPRTTSSRIRLFRNDNRRVPKWYSSAPNRSGLTDTRSSSRHALSRSKGPGASSVDTAHTVDGDLLDEKVLEQRLVGRVVPGIVGIPRIVVERHGGAGLDRSV